MISKIELTDFQCHEHLVLELGKITTLVGPSDSGKSAVMRALDWAVFNNGRTASLIRRGAKAATVSITVDNHTVTRTTKKNAYVVDGTELSSIGRSIPNDVPMIFRMSEDNIQRQHEYLFWFSASGSELTRNFNRVVDISKLDEWVRVGTDKERGFKQDARYCDTRINELSHTVSSLLPYERLEVEGNGLKAEYDKLVEENSVFETLLEIESKRQNVETSLSVAQNTYNSMVQIDGLYKDIVSSRDLISLYDTIRFIELDKESKKTFLSFSKAVLDEFQVICEERALLESLNTIDSSLAIAIARCAKLRQVVATTIPFDELFKNRNEYSELVAITDVLSRQVPDITQIRRIYNELVAIRSEYCGLSDILHEIKQNDDGINALRREYDSIKDDFVTKLDGMCPLCGGAIGDHTHE